MNLTFTSVTFNDIPLIQSLAKSIWYQHYPSVVSIDQIDYMLPRMYSTEKIKSDLSDNNLRYEIISTEEKQIGYLSYRLEPETVFISKLYLEPIVHGKGLGKIALTHVEEFAIQNHKTSLYLYVNKKNEKAIKAYIRFGFKIAESVVTEFGGGFIMDDYLMRKIIS